MNTKTLRQKILDLAIHGKLVAQDPDDEPASGLLKRIKAEKEQQIKEGKIKKSKKTKTTSDTPKSENPPFEIPSSWEWTTLGEISSFLSRGKSPKYSEENKQYPVFAQKCNLKDGGISLEYARFLDPSTICKWDDEYKLKTGDVLVNSTGTGTVGRTRLFDERYLGDYPFVVPDSHVSVVRTMKEIESEFVCIYISSQCIQQYLEDNLAGSTNQKELYIGILCDLHFPLPPLAEQKRIVSEIERWFALIDQIEQSKATLQATIAQAKKKILDLAIHGKLVAQDPDDEPASELLKRINPQAEQMYEEELPKGWTYCKLSDVFTITMGQSPKGETLNNKKGIEFHQGKICFTDKFLLKSEIFTDTPTKIAEPNSILLCVRAPVGVVNITTRRICIGRGLCALQPFEGNINFYFYLLQTLQDSFENQSTGTTFKAISGDIIRNEKIPLPPLAEQKRIVKKIEELFGVLDTIQQELGE